MAQLSDSKMPKDEALRLLRVEMQRCLGSLKGKRQKISQLHEELRLCRGRVNELQSQMDEAKLSATVSKRPELILGDSQSWDSDLNRCACLLPGRRIQPAKKSRSIRRVQERAPQATRRPQASAGTTGGFLCCCFRYDYVITYNPFKDCSCLKTAVAGKE